MIFSFLSRVLKEFVVSLFYTLRCVLVLVFGTSRNSSSSSLIISFVIERVFENGALNIGISRFVVVFRLIWFVSI